jgi:hypothetical protein
MAKSRRRRGADVLAPTPERVSHDPVERLAHQIADADGAVARPFVAIDTLATMERKGTINKQLRAAAEGFRRTFYAAQLDQLKAKDLSRPFVQNARHGDISQHAYIARARVWAIMRQLGGVETRIGSVAWHCVGEEWSLARWCRERPWQGPRVSQEAASGFLVAALEALLAFEEGRTGQVRH